MPVFKDEPGEETVVRHPDGSITKGRLHWNSQGASLILPDNSRKQNDEGYCFRVNHKIVLDPTGNSTRMQLNAPVDLKLKPNLHVRRTYAPRMTQTDVVISPPATEGWYGRMILGTEYFNYSIHTPSGGIDGKQIYWLFIFDDNGTVYESYPIKYYEVETISLKDDIQNRDELLRIKLLKDSDSIRKHYLSILDGPPPPFDAVLRLVQGTPNVIPQLGNTLGETISSIVPSWIDESIRQEIILFLAWIVSGKAPQGDRIELFEKLITMITTRRLFGIHEFRRITNEKMLPYIRILHVILPNRGYQYERDHVERRLVSKIPFQYLSEVVPIALSDLNKRGKIIARIPDKISQNPMKITPDELRFLLYWGGLKLEVIPILPTIGLKELIYLGGAHQWPHRHTVWSGFLEEHNSRFNSMYFPINSIERVKQANDRFLEVDRYLRHDNFSLYRNGRWHIPEKKFLKTANRAVTVNELDKAFLTNQSTSTDLPTAKEAYILDISQDMLFVSNLESGRVKRVYGISTEEYVNALNSLYKRKIIKFQYSATNQPYVGLMVTLRGDRDKVLSITNSLMTYTPMSSARIIHEGDIVILLVRLPFYLIENLIDLFKQNEYFGVDVDISVVSKIRAYRHNLFSRLHKDMKGWDDSVESVESQKRS